MHEEFGDIVSSTRANDYRRELPGRRTVQISRKVDRIMSNIENRLGQRYLIDTHILDATDPASSRLWQLHSEGWIQLCRSDAMDTELGDRSDQNHRSELLDRSAQLVEVHGVMILGHSRPDHAVPGSAEEVADWDELWALMWPGRDRGAPNRANTRRVRDAMHVWTAARYGYDAFITNDGSSKQRAGILTRADAIRDRYGLWIATPDAVVAFLGRLKHRYEIRHGFTQG